MGDGVHILGPLELLVAGESRPVGAPKVQRLLALLALAPNEWISADWLAESLWEGSPPRTVVNTLQTYIKQLRKVLDVPWASVETWGSGYRFLIGAEQLDARQFELACSAARAEREPAQIVATLRAALALWRGPVLADLVADGFGHPVIVRLEHARLDAVEDCLELDLELGHVATVLDQVEDLCREHPYRERLVRLRMLGLYRSGRAVEALRCFQSHRELLSEEVGVEPGAVLRELELAILQREVSSGEALEVRTALDGIESVDIPTRTRFARSGDAHVAYQAVGEGPPDVVVVPGFLSHVEHQWQFPDWARFHRRLSAGGRLIVFDKRGTGLSDPLHGVETMVDRADDLRAVLDAVASKRAVIVAISEGVPLAAQFVVEHPERVAGLVSYAAFVSGDDTKMLPPTLSVGDIEGFLQLFALAWDTGDGLEIFNPSLAVDPERRRAYGRFFRYAASPGGLRTQLELDALLDMHDLMGRIRVPTLVLHRGDDSMVSIDHSRRLAARTDGAELIELDGSDHYPWLGDWESVADAIAAFVTRVG